MFALFKIYYIFIILKYFITKLKKNFLVALSSWSLHAIKSLGTFNFEFEKIIFVNQKNIA
jgi:hypothetical protein